MLPGKRTIFSRLVMYMEQGNMPHVIRLIRAKAMSEEARNAKLHCADCDDEDLEMYMVTNEVWEEAGMEKHKGLLHLKCLEARLGRRLQIEDFPKYTSNRAIFFAFRMGKDE